MKFLPILAMVTLCGCASMADYPAAVPHVLGSTLLVLIVLAWGLWDTRPDKRDGK